MATHTELMTRLETHTCTHDDPSDQHPNITSLTVRLRRPLNTQINTNNDRIGIIQSHLLTIPTSDLNSTSASTLWIETRAFDRAHAPSTKLNKIENYLSNECFFPEKQALLDQAGWVLYVEAVFLLRQFRGRGWGPKGVRTLIGEVLRIKEGKGEGEGVVLLESGPVGVKVEWDLAIEEDDSEDGGGDATEKLARYWRRMGFQAWSYTDETWLCLSTAQRMELQEVLERRESGSRAADLV